MRIASSRGHNKRSRHSRPVTRYGQEFFNGLLPGDRVQSKLEIYGHRPGFAMKTHLKFMKAEGIV